jgi:hypothetical protein
MRLVRSVDKLAKAHVQVADEEADASIQKRDTRRDVAFEGVGLLEDGTSFRLSLLDLSYDGCKITTDLALFPGLKFKLAVTGFSGTVHAHVVWHKDGQFGISFGSCDSEQRPKTPRAYERLLLDAQVLLRRLGRQAYQARLFDLTPNGCKVEFIERPAPGEIVWAKFDQLEAVEAKVRWVHGFYGGLQFVQPIHGAVFDSLIIQLMAANPRRQ